LLLLLLLLLLSQPDVSDRDVTFEEAFSLHSRPGAQRKLLLDFNGHVTQGTLICSAICTGAHICQAHVLVSNRQ
jgi:hypothetical protein